ncbi:MAG: T9SS type A sorting domain-containing protein [Balneolales bacterium]|nr:T9SS type A sorting domain-containing protein [Balneolales bacterium]
MRAQKNTIKFILAAFVMLASTISVAIAQDIPTSNLQLHLKAGVGVTVDGENRVSEWADQSGNDNNATQVNVGTQPILENNVINGEHALKFMGAQHIALPTSSTLGIRNSDYEIFIVYRSIVANTAVEFILGATTNEHFELHTNGGGGLRYIPNMVGQASAFERYIDVGSEGIYTNAQPQIIRLQATETFGNISVNGTTETNRIKDSQSGVDDVLFLGMRGNNSLHLNGYVAEVIIYNTILSEADRDEVEDYLKVKYDVGQPATAPTTQASNISISNVGFNSMTLSLSSGNGEGRIIVAKAEDAVDATPSDLESYNANSSFGSGDSFGTANYVVYSGAGNEVTVSGLAPDTEYHFAAFEFNGAFGTEAYLTTDVPVNSATTDAFPFAGGNGETGTPYQIETAEQLNSMRHLLSSSFILMNNIDLDVEPFNSGAGWLPIGSTQANPFKGSLDGNNFTISNLYINSSNQNSGLFGVLENASISNLTLSSVNITSSQSFTGALGGYSLYGTVNNIQVSGTIAGVQEVGGFYGRIFEAVIVNSSSSANIAGQGTIGGLIGFSVGSISQTGRIENSYSTGNVTATGSGVGGLVGSSSVNIYSSYATGNVTGVSDIGGFVGTNAALINQSYSTGTVVGNLNRTGGLVGQNRVGSSVVDSYAAGSVNGRFTTGGLIGENSAAIVRSFSVGSVSLIPSLPSYGEIGGFIGINTGTITNSYWNTELSGQATSAGGSAKTMQELSQMSTFTNWDFTNTWQMIGGATLPVLRNNPASHRVGVPTITGTEGWRIIANPLSENTFDSLLGSIWTQGFEGATDSNGSPNVYTWATSGSGKSSEYWTPLDNINTSFTPGTGAAVYVYQKDDGPGSDTGSFPKVLTIQGIASNSEQSLTANLNPNINGWALLGNPFAANIDWNATTKSGLFQSVYVYDPQLGDEGDWVYWNGSMGDLTNGEIGAFNAFFVETIAENPTLVIPAEAQTTNATAFLGKEHHEEPVGFSLSLQVEGGQSNTTWFHLSDEASEGIDARDAKKLISLAPNRMSIASQLPDGELLAINHLPLGTELLEIPIQFDSPVSGTHQLVLTPTAPTQDWVIELIDHELNTHLNLNQPDAMYEFEHQSMRKSAVSSPLELLSDGFLMKTSATPRFSLRFSPAQSTSNEPETTTLPQDVSLSQNYPNPFNPTTTIAYSLPQAGAVRLDVYDVLGRQVATLVNNEGHAAGRFSVDFDASRLTTGVYIYRLQAGNTIITKKLSLIK